MYKDQAWDAESPSFEAVVDFWACSRAPRVRVLRFAGPRDVVGSAAVANSPAFRAEIRSSNSGSSEVDPTDPRSLDRAAAAACSCISRSCACSSRFFRAALSARARFDIARKASMNPK
jgi:hypothetical protein